MSKDKAGVEVYEPEIEPIGQIHTSLPPLIETTPKQKRTRRPNKVHAETMLKSAVADISDRASERDTKSERSMASCVKAFNAMYDKDLTETEGWQFMVMLKMSRGKQGDFRADDFTDQASYSALAGESAQEV